VQSSPNNRARGNTNSVNGTKQAMVIHSINKTMIIDRLVRQAGNTLRWSVSQVMLKCLTNRKLPVKQRKWHTVSIPKWAPSAGGMLEWPKCMKPQINVVENTEYL